MKINLKERIDEMKNDNLKPKLLKRRIAKGTDWHIAIDDGYVSYVYELKASKKYSISSLFEKIQKSIRK